MSIYRKGSIAFGFAAVMLMAAAGGAFAHPAHYQDYQAYSAAPMQNAAAYRALSPSSYNLLVGPGVTTVGIAPGDRTTPVGAD